jgi:hypothetical protein
MQAATRLVVSVQGCPTGHVELLPASPPARVSRAARRRRTGLTDVLGGGRAPKQQDQPEHLPEAQIEQLQRHMGTMPNHRSPQVTLSGRLLEPHLCPEVE